MKFTPAFNGLSKVLLLPMLAATMVACAPDSPSLGAANGGGAGIASGVAAPMSDAQFNALPIDTQYKVVNKLLSSVYNGMPVDEFYSLTAGTALRTRQDSDFNLSQLRTAMQTPLSQEAKLELDAEIVGDEDRLDDLGQAAPPRRQYKRDDRDLPWPLRQG